jgi:predicted nucleic acid-binding protein
LDTSIFIFQVETNLKYVHLTHRVFNWLKSSKGQAVTSTITMLELLVHPYRESKESLVEAYYTLFTTYPHLEWGDATLAVCDRAAQLRATVNLKTPDAIQAATSLNAGATGFVSNDPVFRRVSEFEVFILDDVL